MMESRRQRVEDIKTPEFGTGKSIVVLAVVIGCFAILWPKIFYPMMQTAFTATSKFDGDEAQCEIVLDADVKGYPFFAKLCDWLVTQEAQVHSSLRIFRKPESHLSSEFIEKCQNVIMNVCKFDILSVLREASFEDIDTLNAEKVRNLNHCLRRHFTKVAHTKNRQPLRERPPHLHLPQRMRETLGETRPSDVEGKIHFKEGRPFPHPSARQPSRSVPKGGGTMSIVMPLYTVGIVGFFLYTLLKVVFKKKPEETSEPIINDYHMDANYHKFRPVAPKYHEANCYTQKQNDDTCRTKSFLEQYGKQRDEFDASIIDEKDHEIHELRKRLQETEASMQRIMQHMGLGNDTTKDYQPRAATDNCTVRRRTGHDTKDQEKTGAGITSDQIEELIKISSTCSMEEEIRSMDSTPDSDSYEVVSSREKDTTDEDEKESSTHKMEPTHTENEENESNPASSKTSSYEHLNQDHHNPSNSDTGNSRSDDVVPLNGEMQPASELMKALNFDSL